MWPFKSSDGGWVVEKREAIKKLERGDHMVLATDNQLRGTRVWVKQYHRHDTYTVVVLDAGRLQYDQRAHGREELCFAEEHVGMPCFLCQWNGERGHDDTADRWGY